MSLINKIIAALRKPGVNPGNFNDPIAEKISWAPLKGGGTNFKTRKFVKVNENRVVFERTLMMKIFPWIFICGPFIVFIIIYGKGELIVNINEIFSQTNSILLVPLVLLSLGVFMFFKTKKSIVFDKRYGYYWKGKAEPETYNLTENKNFVRLSDIYAIQLIREYISNTSKSGGSYYSYEINLVLKDESRVNVVDHGHKKSIVEDSRLLADFLNVPVWSAL